MNKYFYTFLIVLSSSILSIPATADEPASKWRIQASPYTLHFDPSDEHDDVWMLGLEWQSPQDWLLGGAYFKNSFGQPSWYWYGGYNWDGSAFLKGSFAKLTAGVIVGYDGEYEDKIPINSDGVGLGILPSIGWQYERFALQLNLLGSAGLMFSLNYDLDP